MFLYSTQKQFVTYIYIYIHRNLIQQSWLCISLSVFPVPTVRGHSSNDDNYEQTARRLGPLAKKGVNLLVPCFVGRGLCHGIHERWVVRALSGF